MASQTYEIDTVAGLRFYDGEGGFASHVAVNSPNHVAFHPVTEDVFIVDTFNHVIRKVDQVSGRITTVAGTPCVWGYSGDGGPATQATLFLPTSIAFSPDGKLMYIASDVRVRMVKDGIITTVAGNGTTGYGGDGVMATNTSLIYPYSVTVLPTTGELVIADMYDHRIRKVDLNGTITTIAGTGVETDVLQSNLGDNGPAINATLRSPLGLISNSIGEILFADANNYRIRTIDTSGVITTIAGTGDHGITDDGTPVANAKIGSVNGLAINSAGDVFLADTDYNCIRKIINSTQTITTVAGICHASSRSLSMLGENGSATTSYLSKPSGVAVSNNGEIVISGEHRIRRIDTNGIMTTIAGNGFGGFSGESGIAIDAMLNDPSSVTVTSDGEIFISDYRNLKIRKVDKHGIITAIAGNGEWGFEGDGGSALNAMLSYPGEVVVTDSGDVIFADTNNGRIRKVFRNGTIVTIAGNGTSGFTGDGVLATETALNQPQSVAYRNGEVYIADTGNNRVRKIFVNGTILTVAGNGTDGYCGDTGPAINVCVNRPIGVVVTDAGEIFVSELSTNIVRKIGVDGIISRVTGRPGSVGYTGDGGLAIDATLNCPRGLAINQEGELFIADTNNNVIRKVDKNGIISTVVKDLSYPVAVSFGPNGELLIAESGDKHQITMIDNNDMKVTIAGTTEPGSSISDFHLPENAPLVFVSSVSVLSNTELIVADTYNHMIKKVNMTAKTIVPLAPRLSLSYPRGTKIVNNVIYFADYGNHCIRQMGLTGVINDVVGVCGTGGYSVDGNTSQCCQIILSIKCRC